MGSNFPVAQFQFITVQDPNDNDKAAKRLARSHAVKQALQNKRKLQKASMQNFCIEDGKNLNREGKLDVSRLGAASLDPFDSLPIKGTRLQHLLNNRKGFSSYDTQTQADTLFRPSPTGPRASLQYFSRPRLSELPLRLSSWPG